MWRTLSSTMENIKELIEEINSRKPKDYEKMDIEQISNELHKVMEFEQMVLKKIYWLLDTIA